MSKMGVERGRAYGDERQRQENHGHARQNFDVIALLYSAAGLFDAASAEKLLPQRADLVASVLVLLPYIIQLLYRSC